MGWTHLSYKDFKDFFGDLGLTVWVKFNWLAEVPDGFDKIRLDQVTWTRYSTTSIFYSAGVPKESGNYQLLCSRYETEVILDDFRNIQDMHITANALNVTVYIRDDRFNNAAAFKASLTGVWLIYKKA